MLSVRNKYGTDLKLFFPTLTKAIQLIVNSFVFWSLLEQFVEAKVCKGNHVQNNVILKLAEEK